MNIAVLSRWNTACGVSQHSELIGREFIKNGHKLTVFASDNIRPIDKDENYVIRCCSDDGDYNETFFNPEPFWFLDKEIIKYSNEYEFKNLTIKIFGRDKIIDETLKAEEAYTKRYSPNVIADEFIKLFSRLLIRS